jgi:membrane-anchored glycerophosphoryl diester phosphodiesterase (GDPDase)
MQPDNLDYRAIRKNVEKSLKRRKSIMRWVFLGVNLMMFGVFTIFAWGMAQSTGLLVDGNPQGESLIGALIMLNIGWFTGILFQFISAIVDLKGADNQMRAQIMSEEISKAMLELGADESEAPVEKAKRMMRLSDDGELVEIVEDEVGAKARR